MTTKGQLRQATEYLQKAIECFDNATESEQEPYTLEVIADAKEAIETILEDIDDL